MVPNPQSCCMFSVSLYERYLPFTASLYPRIMGCVGSWRGNLIDKTYRWAWTDCVGLHGSGGGSMDSRMDNEPVTYPASDRIIVSCDQIDIVGQLWGPIVIGRLRGRDITVRDLLAGIFAFYQSQVTHAEVIANRTSIVYAALIRAHVPSPVVSPEEWRRSSTSHPPVMAGHCARMFAAGRRDSCSGFLYPFFEGPETTSPAQELMQDLKKKTKSIWGGDDVVSGKPRKNKE
ncbi:hypothetical protein EDD15DRAFT_387575 [Pisolithus albus]|nr:hypothetical protein EDD15DRAFT_387575 [Pisolithus albus]